MIEVALLRALMADIYFKHSSFSAFSNSYNYQYQTKEFERDKLDYRRLIDIWFCFKLVEYFKEFYNKNLISNQKYQISPMGV